MHHEILLSLTRDVNSLHNTMSKVNAKIDQNKNELREFIGGDFSLFLREEISSAMDRRFGPAQPSDSNAISTSASQQPPPLDSPPTMLDSSSPMPR